MTEEDLRVRLYEPVSATKHNATVDLAQRNGLISVPNLRLSRTAYGTAVDFDASSSESSSKFFRASVTKKKDQYEVRFTQGLIGGVQPNVGGTKISKKGEDGKFPALLVTDQDFDPDENVAAIYFQCTVQHETWAIVDIVPIAAPAKPVKAPWIANKLAGFLIRSGGTGGAVRYDRQLFSNLGFYAANRKTNGFFDPSFYWAT